jgi:hypothetical protein
MSKGKSYILVATDCFSKWTEAYPLGTATTKNITKTLEREFFSCFGYPHVCLSDNGPQFVSNDMLNAIERWEAEGWTTPTESQPDRAPQSRLKERTTYGTHQRQTHHLGHKISPYLIRYSKPAQCTDRISTIGISNRTQVQKIRGLNPKI